MSQTYSLQAISQKSLDRILKQPELFALYHAGGDLEYYRDLKTDEGYLSLWDKIKLRLGMQISIPAFEILPEEKESFHFESGGYLLYQVLGLSGHQDALPLHGSQNLTPFDVGWNPVGYYSPKELAELVSKLGLVDKGLLAHHFDTCVRSNIEEYFRYQPSDQQLENTKQELINDLKKLRIFLEKCLSNKLGVTCLCM